MTARTVVVMSKADVAATHQKEQQAWRQGVGGLVTAVDASSGIVTIRPGIGAPIAIRIENRDWPNWEEIMSAKEVAGDAATKRRVTRPRPGHTDLAGSLKYNHTDARNILERSSARETAARVAVGGLAKVFLRHFGMDVLSHTTAIGNAKVADDVNVS